MYNKERIERIFDLLKEKGSISVNELSVLFQVSGATIRSDLAKMEKAGLITRAHGGAMANSSLYRETLLTERIHDDRKKLIAQRHWSMFMNGISSWWTPVRPWSRLR